jgi:hypothetical protein
MILKILKWLGIAFGALMVFVMMLPKEPHSAWNEPPIATGTACRTNWKLCADTAGIMSNYQERYKVQSACKWAANDMAKYGDPEWPSRYFQMFYNGDGPRTGVVMVVEKEARFINAFNAKARTQVVCAYDMNAGKVIKVSLD